MVDENVGRVCEDSFCDHAGEATTKERIEKRVFPIITRNIQEAYEIQELFTPDETPNICGYYGRACRQMEKEEGANRALCSNCGLHIFAKQY